ncbi:tetratricopeptide repeat protein [Streptomyces sp. NPDC050211]|uniref:tetratricopeptide repeat protein n=1 Tax=Streptomyces sp. NPDC050211 TaxID=3154932 RepID=UPI003421A57A
MTGNTFHEFRRPQTLHVPPPAFELQEDRGHADLADHDRRLEEILREQVAAAASEPAHLLAPPAVALDETKLHLGLGGEDLLVDARVNVGNGDYRTALELLEDYLSTAPDHQEARYLRAFCLFHLDGDNRTQALRILRPLRDEPLPADLRERVQELRRELRRLLTPAEIAAYAQSATSDPEGALDRVEAFLELAPEEGTLSYLLALGQARAGQLESALETAERGVREADTDKERVRAYACRLKLALLIPHSARAVAEFKNGRLRQARAELAAMDPRWRRTTVLDDFDSHIRSQIEGKRTSGLPEDRAEDLYTLIAESDAQQAAALMAMGRLEDAARLMAHLLSLVPGFRWLNFLYAVCLLRLGRDPDRAAACAEIARRDPTITQAPELLEAIRNWQEAAVVNAAVKTYLDAMEAVRGGASADGLATLRTRLTALQHKLPDLRGKTRTEAGRKVVRDLDEAIAARLAEIDQAEMSVAVSGLVRRFNELATQVGRSNPRLMRIQLNGILQDARRIRDENGRSLPTDARKLLDELIGTITRTMG